MSFSAGIVGLPNVGKSTLFKALTRNKVDIAPYPFTTINPNVGIVKVPDERLEKIAAILKPEKITPTIIEFVDIAGLVKGAHKGEGLGNQFLAQIRNCDAIVEVVRGFQDSKVENILQDLNPQRDIEIIKLELLMKDSETLENLTAKLEKEIKSGDKKAIKKLELFNKIKKTVSEGKSVSEIDLSDEEKSEIKEYQFLTQKPIIYLLNTSRENLNFNLDINFLQINLKDEEETSELSEKELEEMEFKSCLDQIILYSYNILDLITFFTIAGGKETRAWTLKKGKVAPEAGGVVHSDFKEKFIRADVIPWELLVKSGSWKTAKESGLIKTAGKEYIVQDGDVIEFKI